MFRSLVTAALVLAAAAPAVHAATVAGPAAVATAVVVPVSGPDAARSAAETNWG